MTKVIHYFPRGERHGTSHVVTEERETEVDTACGRTLRKRLSSASTRGGFVSEYGQTQVTDEERCGNCSWEAVDDE